MVSLPGKKANGKKNEMLYLTDSGGILCWVGKDGKGQIVHPR